LIISILTNYIYPKYIYSLYHFIILFPSSARLVTRPFNGFSTYILALWQSTKPPVSHYFFFLAFG